MKLLLLLCVSLASLFLLSPSAGAAQFGRAFFVQRDILRVAPDDAAAFVPIALPCDVQGVCLFEPSHILRLIDPAPKRRGTS